MLESTACGFRAPWAPTRIPRIGYGSYGPREAFATEYMDPFLQGLRDLGYVEGENIAIDWRFTGDQSNEEFHRVATELVGLSVDAIVSAVGVGITFELKKLTTIIPIVAIMLAPVESGLVASLAHPGGNITGVTAETPGGFVKPLDLLREVVPGLTHVAFLVDGRGAVQEVASANWNSFMTSAESVGLEADRVDLVSGADVEAAFQTPAMRRAQAFVRNANGLFLDAPHRLADVAIKYQLPGITNNRRNFVEAGFLMTYGPSQPAIYRRAATYIDKILKGANPADVPIE